MNVFEDLYRALVSAPLNEHERFAIMAHHGLCGDGTLTEPKSMEEIAVEVGVSKERIRQRLATGRSHMRRWLVENGVTKSGDIN